MIFLIGLLFLFCVLVVAVMVPVFAFMVLFLLFLFVLRCLYMIETLDRHAVASRDLKKARTMIVMGSGGHTSEMLRITEDLDRSHYSPRVYVMASSDSNTEKKILAREGNAGDYVICKIPRSREVKQSYLTSVFTTLISFAYSVPLILRHRPQLLICNGPGVCVPVCLVDFFARALFLVDTKIFFIESICRVTSLSLTGKILMFFADSIIVQWPQLCSLYRRARFIGRL